MTVTALNVAEDNSEIYSYLKLTNLEKRKAKEKEKEDLSTYIYILLKRWSCDYFEPSAPSACCLPA